MTNKDNNKQVRNISVFIASPGDLITERKKFRDAINLLNDGFADGANVKFEALGWEDTLASTGRRNQSVINQDIDRCDVFFLVMHRRWGQPALDDSPYSSYTEEEFHRALDRFSKEQKPEIFVFFKRVDASQEADAGPQLQKVLDFRHELEESRQVLYRTIDDKDQSFQHEVDTHLRAYVKGELPSTSTISHAVILPLSIREEVSKAKDEANKHAKKAELAHQQAKAAEQRALALELSSAEEASTLALEGLLEMARTKFVKLIADTRNLRILFLAYEYFNRTGDLDTAEQVLERWLELSGSDSFSGETAAGLSNLGNVYQDRGDLDRAEVMHKKSLAMSISVNFKEGIAGCYCNLGVIYQFREDLERAVEMYEKSLVIYESLDRKGGIASQYGNLGNVYQIRGDLDRAVEMYEKSLAIDESLGRKKGMAGNYDNLGDVYRVRGDLDRAVEMYEKSIVLLDELGSPNADKVRESLEKLRQSQ